MRRNLPTTRTEREFGPVERVISTTDTKGRITSFNQAFLDISGYTAQEVLGQPHNLLRHPDMPAEAFADLWQTIQRGESWLGLVKNRCKNGDFYWVNAFVMPVYRAGELVGYQSVRTKPDRRHVAQAERTYARLQKGRRPGPLVGAAKRQAAIMVGAVFMPLLALNIFSGLEPMEWGVGAVAAVVAAMTLGIWQKKAWQRPVARSLQTHRSDISCLSYCGEVSAQAQVEVALQALDSQQATLLQLLHHSGENLRNVVRDSNANLQRNNQGVDRQGMEISQLAAAICEISHSIDEVAGNAVVTATSASEASAEVTRGKSVVEQTKAAIEGLVAEVNSANSMITELKNDADGISKIVSVINSITSQTGMLAINASVEAARAGNAGKGFSVVADEVRALANSTQESTTEIEKMILELQARTTAAAGVIEESRNRAESTAEKALGVYEALELIDQRVNNVNELNSEIAEAAEKQSAVTREINGSVNSINEAAGEISKAAKQSAASGKALEDVAEEINSVVRQFQTQ